MKVLKKIGLSLIGLGILFCMQFFANFLVGKLHICFPSPLLGLILLAILLKLKLIPLILLEDISEFLLNKMPLFFVPLFVGIILYSHLILTNFWGISLIIFFTTFFTMILSALLVDFIIEKVGKNV